MEDEVFGSIRFAFEWRKTRFAMLYLAFVALNLLSLGIDYYAERNTPLLVVGYAAWFFLSASAGLLVVSLALKTAKLKTRSFAPADFVKNVVLAFASFFAGLFSVYNIRGLALLGSALLLVAASYAFLSLAWPLVALAVLFFLAYLLAVLYNFMRLGQAMFFFAGTKKGVAESMRNSLDVTLGNVLWLSAIMILVCLVVGVVSVIAIAIPSLVLSFALSGVEQALASVAVQLLNAFLSPIMTFSYYFGLLSVFKFLLKRKKKKVKWNF